MKMKVKELIEKLKAADPEMLVVTRGPDEEGFADIHTVETVHVIERTSAVSREAISEYIKANNDGLTAILIDHG